HKPIIYEAKDHLGGVFVEASAESYKEPLRRLLDWYISEMKRLNIEIHLNERIESLDKFSDKKVIVATGSKPRIIKSINGYEKMIEALEYLSNEKEVGKNVCIIGGGLTGCEIAYDLLLKGHNVSIVEMKDDLIKQRGVCLANSSYLREYFYWKRVPVYLETTLEEVKDKMVIAKDNKGKRIEIECDSVISSMGYIPNPLVTKGAYLVGDCSNIGNLKTVIWQAYEVAMKI
nr:NAD(P)/FAD-dependent oxidoreductase [Acholeplasmatales bacterium]